MNTPGLFKYAGAVVALAICAACGALPLSSSKGQNDVAFAPSGAAVNATYVGRTLFVNGRPVTAARLSLSPLPRYAPIVPDRHRRPKTFEYVINQYGTYATIFDYPKSTAQIGSINNAGGQGCTNVLYGYGKKIIWNVAGQNQITEYHVIKRSLRTLSVPYSFPTSCAMNSMGDLAVGIYGTSGGGHVLIFKNATGTPKDYATPLYQEFFDGYTPNGDLFADGFTGDRSGFALIELPKGGTKFEKITTSNSVQFPGSVQWDGTYVTVFDQLADALYQYKISGTKATLKHTVTIGGAGDCAQTWIVPGRLYCGDAFNNDGGVYKYPAGGSPIAILTGNFDSPLGVVAAER